VNIYFACSITGGRAEQPVYQAIVTALHAAGHTVPTAVLARPEVVQLEKVADPADIYARDVAWIAGCDLLLAEITTPSHGVGYEIGYALQLGKPVFCLHREGVKVSKMITGNPDPNLRLHAYQTGDEAARWVEEQFS